MAASIHNRPYYISQCTHACSEFVTVECHVLHSSTQETVLEGGQKSMFSYSINVRTRHIYTQCMKDSNRTSRYSQHSRNVWNCVVKPSVNTITEEKPVNKLLTAELSIPGWLGRCQMLIRSLDTKHCWGCSILRAVVGHWPPKHLMFYERHLRTLQFSCH